MNSRNSLLWLTQTPACDTQDESTRTFALAPTLLRTSRPKSCYREDYLYITRPPLYCIWYPPKNRCNVLNPLFLGKSGWLCVLYSSLPSAVYSLLQPKSYGQNVLTFCNLICGPFLWGKDSRSTTRLNIYYIVSRARQMAISFHNK